MIAITSCTIDNKLDIDDTDKAYISLSKGRGLNGSPVYDLWVFKNGKVLYKGIDNVDKKGIHKTIVSSKTIKKIKKLTESTTAEDIEKPRGRELPLTIIKFEHKKIAFQESRIKGNILILRDLLEKVKKKI